MTTPQPAPPPGAELDAECWTLLGYPKPETPDPSFWPLVPISLPWMCAGFIGDDPIWNVSPISTDPGAAFRALEMWREQKAERYWEGRSAVTGEAAHDPLVLLWEPHGKGWAKRGTAAATFPLAAALALRAALGGKT